VTLRRRSPVVGPQGFGVAGTGAEVNPQFVLKSLQPAEPAIEEILHDRPHIAVAVVDGAEAAFLRRAPYRPCARSGKTNRPPAHSAGAPQVLGSCSVEDDKVTAQVASWPALLIR